MAAPPATPPATAATNTVAPNTVAPNTVAPNTVAPNNVAAARTTTPRGRRARLVLSRVDPWSVMKLAFLLGLAALITLVVAVTIIWAVLAVAGVFSALENNITSLLNANDDGTGRSIDVSSYFSFTRWVGFAMAVGFVNVILMTALATVSTFLYNIATSLVGGVQVTLSEDV